MKKGETIAEQIKVVRTHYKSAFRVLVVGGVFVGIALSGLFYALG